MKGPIPGRLYRFKRDGSLFVPLHRVDTGTVREVAWRCLTQDGTATLWLWAGSYDLVEEA